MKCETKGCTRLATHEMPTGVRYSIDLTGKAQSYSMPRMKKLCSICALVTQKKSAHNVAHNALPGSLVRR